MRIVTIQGVRPILDEEVITLDKILENLLTPKYEALMKAIKGSQFDGGYEDGQEANA